MPAAPGWRDPEHEMGHIFLLALAAAVYPTLLAGVVLILTRPRPARLLLAFLLGGMTISIVLGMAIVTALRTSHAVHTPNSTARPVLDIVAGLLSLALAWALRSGRISELAAWRRRKPAKNTRSTWTTRALGRESTLVAFGVGVILNLPGVWYLAALADIAAADYSPPHELLLIVLFNVIMFTLVEVPLVFYAVKPELARRLVDAFSAWVRSHGREIGVLVATTVGVWLIVKGVVTALS
jgi:hypothetical protein